MSVVEAPPAPVPPLTPKSSDRQTLLLCGWSGAVSVFLVVLGLIVIGGFIPPQSPSASSQEIADYYTANATQIRIGMLVAMIGITLFVPFGVAIATQTRRVENRPIVTYIQLACVAIAALEGVMCTFIWATAAFRPADIGPDITRMLNDFGWFAFLFDVPPFTLWLCAIGYATLRDRSSVPIYPRWVGYFNFFAAFIFMPAELMGFFKTGPFAFDGLLALYIPAGLYFTWMLVMTPVVLQAIKREGADFTPPATGVSHYQTD